MSWLNRVRNALPFTEKRDTPDNLWIKCPSCSEMLFTKDYEDNLSVCSYCDHHGRIGADARFDQLLDAGYAGLDHLLSDCIKMRLILNRCNRTGLR